MSVVVVLITCLAGVAVDPQAVAQPDPAPLSDLLLALQEDDEDVRLVAASLLGQEADANDDVTMAALGEVVDNQNEKHRVRSESVRALAQIGGDSKAVQRHLMKLAANEQQDWRVRATALQSLYDIDQGESLRQLLGDVGIQVRTNGPTLPVGPGLADDQVAGLTLALKNADERVRRLAGLALTVAGDARSVPALKKAACEDDDFAVREAARAALGAMGESSWFSAAEFLGSVIRDFRTDSSPRLATPIVLATGGCLHGVF